MERASPVPLSGHSSGSLPSPQPQPFLPQPLAPQPVAGGLPTAPPAMVPQPYSHPAQQAMQRSGIGGYSLPPSFSGRIQVVPMSAAAQSPVPQAGNAAGPPSLGPQTPAAAGCAAGPPSLAPQAPAAVPVAARAAAGYSAGAPSTVQQAPTATAYSAGPAYPAPPGPAATPAGAGYTAGPPGSVHQAAAAAGAGIGTIPEVAKGRPATERSPFDVQAPPHVTMGDDGVGAQASLSNQERIKLFLETQDWNMLEQPLLFKPKDNPNFWAMWCRYICPTCAPLPCVVLCVPLQILFPRKVYEHFEGVYIDQEKIWEVAAMNDCCCHIRKGVGRTSIRLEDIKEVYIEASCWGDCDANELVIESKITRTTATATGGKNASVSVSTRPESLNVAYLEDKRLAKQCIDLAVKLHRQQTRITPALLASLSMKGSGSSDTMQDRLKRISALKQNGVLTEEEVAGSKMHLLQTDPDPTIRLQELGELWVQQMVTMEEFMQMKAKVLMSGK